MVVSTKEKVRIEDLPLLCERCAIQIQTNEYIYILLYAVRSSEKEKCMGVFIPRQLTRKGKIGNQTHDLRIVEVLRKAGQHATRLSQANGLCQLTPELEQFRHVIPRSDESNRS